VRALTSVLRALLLLASGPTAAQNDQPRKEKESATVGAGRTPPEDKGQLQPQGWTGPIDTESGGAPAESTQGQSPPGMQSAPEGSTKTVEAPNK
jgi:hypothetical protein